MSRLCNLAATPSASTLFRRGGASLLLLCLGATLIGFPTPGVGAQVRVPVNLDADFLNRVLIDKAFSENDNTAVPWNDGTGCNYLILSDPKISIVDGQVMLLSRGEARVGKAVSAKSCLTILDWNGFLQTEQEPRIDTDGSRVRFKVSNSRLLNDDMSEGFKSKTVWNWVKKHAHPQLERVELDLSEVIQDIRNLLPEFIGELDADSMRELLESMHLDNVRFAKDAVVTDLVIAVESETGTAPPSAGDEVPTLSSAELAAWGERWQAWDSFVTYTIKELASATESRRTRTELLDVMLQARLELDDMLGQPIDGRKDPLRNLFIRSWERLAPLMREVSHGIPARSAIQMFGFIAAGDALTALDRLGPVTGMEISVAGLRRMARMLAHSQTEDDPLVHDANVIDPELRDLFDFGPPLDVPELVPSQGWLDTLLPSAWAGISSQRLLAQKLNGVIVTRSNARTLVPMVRDLLDRTITDYLRKQPLETPFEQLSRPMLLATAWQESCFRQHVRKNGKIVPLRSRAGAVGLMQVRPSIWRGFYEPEYLKRDIAYNARAGTEILMHYMKDYVIAGGEHERPGSMDNVVRATYATYNGGPAHLKRYRKAKTSKRLRKIDNAFWNKFETIRSGQEGGPLRCFGIQP